MQEIANQFKEEFTELLSRYKEQLTNAQIMSILQSVTRKQIGFKDNPERFPAIDEINHMQTERDFKNFWNTEEAKTHYLCSLQEIAEADCCGNVYKCKNACGKLKMNITNISDYQGEDRCTD